MPLKDNERGREGENVRERGIWRGMERAMKRREKERLSKKEREREKRYVRE